MFDLFVENVAIEDIKKDAENFDPNSSVSYHIAYPEFINYFKNIDYITKHNVVIGAHFAYGWMPTIFDFRSDNFESVTQILNAVKAGNAISIPELKILKNCFNNSLVGTSKILHFVNPEYFAIWDSKICRYLFKKETYGAKIGKPEAYVAYLEFCKYMTNMAAFKEIQQIMEAKINQKMTPYRAIEMAMFGSESLKQT